MNWIMGFDADAPYNGAITGTVTGRSKLITGTNPGMIDPGGWKNLHLLTTSSALDAMILGLRSVCSACLSSERKFPSQFRRKLRAALKSVGVLSESGRPSGVTSWALALAPFVRVSWHDQQLRVLS